MSPCPPYDRRPWCLRYLKTIFFAVSTADPMFKSPEVLYITMALIGLLVVCVFVIAGLVLVVAKRRRDAGRPTRCCAGLQAGAKSTTLFYGS